MLINAHVCRATAALHVAKVSVLGPDEPSGNAGLATVFIAWRIMRKAMRHDLIDEMRYLRYFTMFDSLFDPRRLVFYYSNGNTA